MTQEELEALRLAQEAETTNPMMQPTDLIGQQGQQETGMDTNPLLTAGLGLGSGFVASQTGGAPATSQVLSSFAQKVAAQDAANLAAQRAAFNPAIIGQNLPTGGASPAVTGQPKPAKTPTAKQITPKSVIGGSNIGLGGRLAGSLLTLATMPNPIGDSSVRGAYDNAVAAGEDPATAAARLGTKDTSIRGLDTSNREVDFMPDGTGVLNGVSLFTGGAKTTGNNYADVVNADNARREAFATGNVYPPVEQPQDIQPVATVVPTVQSDAQPTVESIILGKQARGPDATFTPEELSQISSIQSTDQANSAQFVQDYQAGQMGIAKSLQDFGNVDDLRAVEAQLAEKGIVRDLATPFLDGAKSIGEANAISSFTPRSTFTQADGRIMQEDEFGQQREITADQLQQFEGDMAQLGQPTAFTAPMGVDATRARLGGMTLNQYLNAPNGTEGVYGLRTDPQGRMIPAGFETRADAYRSYEDDAAAREGRLDARMQQPGESITERDTRIAGERTQSSQNVPTDVRQAMLTPEGSRTAKQINRLARWSGSTQGQEMGGVAGLAQSLQPVDAQKQQYDAMRVYKLGLEIDKMQQEKPSEYQESAAEVDEAIAAGSIKPEDRNKFILRDLGWQAKGGEDSSDLMSIIYGDGSQPGGEPKFKVGEVREQGGKKYRFDGTNWNEL